ncbi:hypothetical protein PSV08DRAFT_2891 [Bipolaris maydis]|uniref:uncharacterized protein n=1 Tax=Cochliobolus heterostrophus TaxID=5016 RepID=UPI0024D610AF|nr:hypothetical protein PSV08DRAFT_2891 [Bipolaris maydis]
MYTVFASARHTLFPASQPVTPDLSVSCMQYHQKTGRVPNPYQSCHNDTQSIISKNIEREELKSKKRGLCVHLLIPIPPKGKIPYTPPARYQTSLLPSPPAKWQVKQPPLPINPNPPPIYLVNLLDDPLSQKKSANHSHCIFKPHSICTTTSTSTSTNPTPSQKRKRNHTHSPLLRRRIPRLHKRLLRPIRILLRTHLPDANLGPIFGKDDVFLLHMLCTALSQFFRVEENLKQEKRKNTQHISF